MVTTVYNLNGIYLIKENKYLNIRKSNFILYLMPNFTVFYMVINGLNAVYSITNVSRYGIVKSEIFNFISNIFWREMMRIFNSFDLNMTLYFLLCVYKY